MKKAKVAIILLCLNEKHFLKECLDSLISQTYKNITIYLVDNNSDDGSVAYVKKNYPMVSVIQNSSNVGYAKGNNIGIEKAFREGADFCIAINTDTKADKKLVNELLKTYYDKSKSNVKLGLIQPVVLLYDKPNLLNTDGNAIHFLGFGYCKDYLQTYKLFKIDKEIISASGACLFISKEYFISVGKLDDDFFLYNEDQNLSWRGTLKGYHHFLSKKAIIYHKYNFNKQHSLKMYHSEKNRLMILLENYSLKTLLLLFPILIINELFILVYSIASGWILLKLKSYLYIFRNLKTISAKRSKIQSSRLVVDRKIMEAFDSTLDFVVFNSYIVRHIVNPIFRTYYNFILQLT